MILYNEAECLFNTNGIGRLSEAIRARATEALNGEYELEVEYPISGKHYSDLKAGLLILARHDDSNDLQPFRIYRISRPMSGRVTINARHISYDLANVPMLPFSATSVATALQKLQGNPYFGTPFRFTTDIQEAVETPYELASPMSVRQVLGGAEGSILEQYGGEYEFDRFMVRLLSHRGDDNHVSIRYGKNLTDVTRDTDTDGKYGAILPYYLNAEDGSMVTLPELTLSIPGSPTFSGEYRDQAGTIYDDGNGNEYTGVTSETKVLAVDLSAYFWEAPSVAALRVAAQKHIKGVSASPADSLRVSFVNLWQTEEYKNYAPLQSVLMGDTVHVFYPALGVNVTMRVIRTVFDLINERYDVVELGSPTYNLNQAIGGISAGVADQSARNAVVQVTKSAMSMIDQQTQLISGQKGGNYIVDKDASGRPIGWVIMDSSDKAEAQNVLRANLSGIGFSQSGYNGPFTTAWTIDGKFNASFIQTGTLIADLIKAGILSDGLGKFYLNMQTGELRMQDGTFTGTVYADAGEIGPLEVTAEGLSYSATIGAAEYVLEISPSRQGDALKIYRDADVQYTQFAVPWFGPVRAQGYAVYLGDTKQAELFSGGLRTYDMDGNEVLGVVGSSGALVVSFGTAYFEMAYDAGYGKTEINIPNGEITMNGRLLGSHAETISGTYNGLTITLYRNAGCVSCYIRGTTAAAMATGSAYVTLFTPADSSWMPKERMISYHMLTASGIRGQVNPQSTNIQLGYTRNNANTAADIPAGTAIYCMLTWAAK